MREDTYGRVIFTRVRVGNWNGKARMIFFFDRHTYLLIVISFRNGKITKEFFKLLFYKSLIDTLRDFI